MEYNCTMCNYVALKHKDFCSHIVRVHKNDPRFMVFCQAGKCCFSTKRWNSYKSHISKYHRHILAEDITLCNNEDIEEAEHETEENHENLADCALMLNAGYLLSLETKHNLSQTAINVVAENTSELIAKHLEKYKTQLLAQIRIRGHQNIEEILNEEITNSTFDHLKSEHKRLSFYEKEFKMISPRAALLGYHLKKSKGTIVRVRDLGYYIPFKDLIKALYSLKEFLHWMEHGHKSRGDFINDICDADYVKNHPLFARNGKALQIVLYNDDLEIVNPLGSHVKKHKIILFYCAFANIPPEYRSKLQTIFLVAIAKSKNVKLHGVSKLLEDFIQTVNAMSSNGLQIEISGKQYNVQGAVIMAPADTPAANSIGGFKEGVGFAYKKCRTCFISNNEMRRKFRDEEFNLRTHADYIVSCNTLESNVSKEARAYWSKMWGINARSCLTDLTHFNIIECLVHDPMHVFLEGVVPYELALLLIHCIDNEKYFTLRWLNSQIEGYSYSKASENCKPEPLERKHYFVEIHVKQTASAMLNLLNMLPFILSPKIPRGDAKWITFLKLIQITFLCINPFITNETVDDLRHLIENHHINFQKAYPKALIRPKMHFICHFPRQLRLYGPGRFQWCMRFEAKHAFFKNKRWKCFKNLPLSMAKFHQKWLCGQMVSYSGTFSENFFYAGDEIKEGDVVLISDMTESHKLCVLEKFPNLNSIFVTKQAMIHGCLFKEGSILIESFDDSHIPNFVFVVAILIKEHEKYFLTQQSQIVEFDNHSLSYQLEFDHEFRVINYFDLTVKFPLEMIVSKDGEMCVLNKYAYLSMDLD